MNDICVYSIWGVCTLQGPYMDVTMVVCHVFLRYKFFKKKSIEIIKKGFIYLKLS